MLSLFIMRHANSDWSDIQVSDFNRSISSKGIEELELLSNKIKELKIEFDLIFTSPDKRTIQTFEILKESLKLSNVQIKKDNDLYEGSLENFLLKLKYTSKLKKKILIITHEPNIQWLIDFFLSSDNIESQKLSIKEFATSSITNINFSTSSWNEISNINCKFNFFINPSDYSI